MVKIFLSLVVLVSISTGAEFVRDDRIGVVIDERDGLMWQDDPSAAAVKLTWREAGGYCSALNLGGYREWRLPTADELDALADEERFKHGIYPVFENVGSGGYWSATEDSVHREKAWMTLIPAAEDTGTTKRFADTFAV